MSIFNIIWKNLFTWSISQDEWAWLTLWIHASKYYVFALLVDKLFLVYTLLWELFLTFLYAFIYALLNWMHGGTLISLFLDFLVQHSIIPIYHSFSLKNTWIEFLFLWLSCLFFFTLYWTWFCLWKLTCWDFGTSHLWLIVLIINILDIRSFFFIRTFFFLFNDRFWIRLSDCRLCFKKCFNFRRFFKLWLIWTWHCFDRCYFLLLLLNLFVIWCNTFGF